MCKVFNVSADCKPNLHYMVNIEERLQEFKLLIDRGEYLAVNRPLQYGKTTILRALNRFLQNDYIVFSLDFQNQLSDAKFKNENVFSVAFARAILKSLQDSNTIYSDLMRKAVEELKIAAGENNSRLELVELFEYLSDICAASKKPVILMIDEVDSATNNQVFLDFLAQLRGYYIDRDVTPTFRSVILMSVYDIKNLKLKIRSEDEQKTNSPWNIAADFNVDMSFSVKDISGMLAEYEHDYNTGMDIAAISALIYDYTSGYPFLVSRICKIIDEKIAGSEEYPNKQMVWTRTGFLEAINLLLSEKNTLFESLINKLHDYPELCSVLYSLLFTGQRIVYNPYDYAIDIAVMFGFVKESNRSVIVANRIFETLLYNMFLTTSEIQSSEIYKAALQDRSQLFNVDS